MSIIKTETNLSELKINYLSQEMYNTALANDEINENELYFTPYDVRQDILNFFYPIGSYYETSDTTFNPNTAWGGTWVLEAAGQVHVSAGTGYAAGSTGGATTKSYTPGGSISDTTLTDAQMAHGHDFTQPTISVNTNGSVTEKEAVTSGESSGNTGTSSGSTGGPSTTNTGESSGSTGGPSTTNTGAGTSHSHGTNSSTYNSFILTVKGDGNEVGKRSLKNGTGTEYANNVYAKAAVGRGSATGTEASHTHSLSSHTHSLNSHVHTLNSHTHSLNSHVHTLNSHTHSLNAHTHSLSSHTHSLNSHTHSLNAHTHSIPKHTHGFTNPTYTATNGSVSNLSGASSTRTAHGHTWTGTAADIDVMQPYIVVNRWHRTA